MSYTHVTRWLLPIIVLLALATLMFFAQLSMHSHAAAPKHNLPAVTTPATATPVSDGGSGGMQPDSMWHF